MCTHTRGGGRKKSLSLQSWSPQVFRLEPYIWTYIFMLYFILSYMLGSCLRDIYVYLLAHVSFRLRDLFTKSPFRSSVLTPMYLKILLSLVSVVLPSNVVLSDISRILLESAGGEERETPVWCRRFAQQRGRSCTIFKHQLGDVGSALCTALSRRS